MPDQKKYFGGVIGLTEPATCHPNRVTPKEFLAWAEKDIASSDARGRGNALSNIKKALHSRLDELIDKTHLPFTRDWNPRFITTEQKLSIIRELGIKQDAIVDLITSIRDDYEHRYIVPELKAVKAYLNAAELWVEKTYDSNDFPRLAFINLPLQGVGLNERKPNGSLFTMVQFVKPEEVSCFLNSKKALFTIHKDGTSEERAFRSFDIKEMLRLESPHIRQARDGTSRMAFDEESIMDLLERYRIWLKQTLTAGLSTSS